MGGALHDTRVQPTETQAMCTSSNKQSCSIAVFCVIYAGDWQVYGGFPWNCMIPRQVTIIQLNKCAPHGTATIVSKAELSNPKAFPGRAP